MHIALIETIPMPTFHQQNRVEIRLVECYEIFSALSKILLTLIHLQNSANSLVSRGKGTAWSCTERPKEERNT